MQDLPYREPWMGLPEPTPQQEQINRLHREIEALREKKTNLQYDWDEVQSYIKGLDPLSRQRVEEIFADAIRDAEESIRDRLLEIHDREDGAYA